MLGGRKVESLWDLKGLSFKVGFRRLKALVLGLGGLKDLGFGFREFEGSGFSGADVSVTWECGSVQCLNFMGVCAMLQGSEAEFPGMPIVGLPTIRGPFLWVLMIMLIFRACSGVSCLEMSLFFIRNM